MVNPAFEIRMVKENLDLSMALLQAVQEEKVTARQLFRDGPMCKLRFWTSSPKVQA